MIRPGSPNTNQQKGCVVRLLVVFLLIVAVSIFFLSHTGAIKGIISQSTPTKIVSTTRPVTPNPVKTKGPTATPSDDVLNLSDGDITFDVQRLDGLLKQQASTDLKAGQSDEAQRLWEEASNQESEDAEPLIYEEDQRVLASGSPYITLVVATMLTGTDSDIVAGREGLQGAYIAQKTSNDGFLLHGGVLVRLLIANSGGNPQDATKIAQQIVQKAQQDHTIVGVMGWPFSAQSLAAITILSNAHIPMVSQTASTDALTGISSFFFRVCPSNLIQAIIGAQYVKNTLKAKRVVLFVDPKNSYSLSLANDFTQALAKAGVQIIHTENYTRGKGAGLPPLLQNALTYNPDLIYFSGYADDMGVLMTNLQTSDSNLQMMGGDALYQLGAYSSSAHANYHRLRFTAFAFPDEWQVLRQSPPAFFANYTQAYDPHAQQPAGTYGYNRPDADVILSYDATLALLQASNNVLINGQTNPTPDDLQQSLANMNDARSIQGVSGQIAFGPDGNPISKAVVVLSVSPQGYTQLQRDDIQGCFLKGQCS